MAIPYPCVLVFSPGKGGVGTSTVAAGLVHFAPRNVVGMDLTGTCHLPFFLGVMRPIALGSVIRHRNLMPSRVEEIIQRHKPVLALDWESRTYSDRLIELIHLLHARIPLVLDGGDEPHPGILPLATHLVAVTRPDVRALDRLTSWLEQQSRPSAEGLIIVENCVEESLVPDRWGTVVRLPLIREADGDFHRLMREEPGEILRELSDHLLPAPATTRQPPGAPEKGILRGWFRKFAEL